MNPTSASQDIRRSVETTSQVNLLHSGMTNPQCHNASTTSTKIKLSLSQLTTIRWPLEEELLQLKSIGYDGIGLWRPKVSDIGEDAVADVLRDASVGVASLSFAGGFTGRNGFSYEDAVADARDAICEAQLLGAENLIVVSGPRNNHTVRHSRRLLTDALNELSEHAMLRGVRLSLLPMQHFFAPTWTYLNTLDETLELLSRVNHPSVGLAFDTYHLWREPLILNRIAELAPLTGVVQISDSLHAPQADSDRCFPGEGRIPLTSIINAFQQAGYTGYFDVHVWSDECWTKSKAEMLRLCQETFKSLVDCSDLAVNPTN